MNSSSHLPLPGRGPLALYNNSPSRALKAIYPEHDWQEWRFGKVPRNFWDDLANQKKFVEDVAKQLRVGELDDWFGVKAADIRAKGSSLPPSDN